MKNPLKLITIFFILLSVVVFFFRKDIQVYVIRDNARKFCHSRDTNLRAACITKLDVNFATCIPTFLAQQVDSDGFFACLGIAETKPPEMKPAAPIMIASCENSNFAAIIEFHIGQPESRDKFKPINWKDKTVYVSESASLDNRDFTKMTLNNEDGVAVLKVEFTKEGKNKLAEATSHNINKNMAITLNGTLESFPVILSAINSDYALVTLTSIPAATTICKS